MNTLADMSFDDLVTEASGRVLKALLNGSLEKGVTDAVLLTISWRREKDDLALSAHREQRAGDGMCNACDPSARCICREEFGHRVCVPSPEKQGGEA